LVKKTIDEFILFNINSNGICVNKRGMGC
jgi:hypothetical protein